MAEHEITPEDRALLESQGMREVEPGRWVSGWQDQNGNPVEMPGGAYLDELMATGRQMSTLDAELSGGAGAWAQPVDVSRLLEDDEPDEPVGVPLGILTEHLEDLAGIDDEALVESLEGFMAERPFVTTEDALRAVLRRFGVRAKVIAGHLDIVDWNEDGWQLVEVYPGAVSRSRPI